MIELCYDIHFHIFEYFELNDVYNAKFVSKQFNYILSDDFLWKTYYKRDYHIKHKCLDKLSKKDAYKKCHDIDVIKQTLHINESVYHIMNLQELYVYGNQIKKIPIFKEDLLGKETPTAYPIPKQIGELVNLQILNLNQNQIKEVPKEIGKLVNLRILNLCTNQIKEIPKKIGKLAKLRELYMHTNQIKEISLKIGKLVNLQRLYLCENQIKEIPKEIGKLVNLQRLYLYENQIKEIPKEIGKLVNLQILSLDQNQIKEISKEIGKLVNLQILYLFEN